MPGRGYCQCKKRLCDDEIQPCTCKKYNQICEVRCTCSCEDKQPTPYHTTEKLTVKQQKNKDLKSVVRSCSPGCEIKFDEHKNLIDTLTNDVKTLKEQFDRSPDHRSDEPSVEQQKNKDLEAENLKLKKELQECKSLNFKQQKNKDLEVENLKLKKELQECQSLNFKLDKKCKILSEEINELQGNVRIFCRVRPRTPKEVYQMKKLCNITYIEDQAIEVGKLDGSDTSCSGSCSKLRKFSFDKVFAPTASQEAVFKELSLLVQSVLDGRNVCIFAYGQTGSGKTYTMEGERGLQTEGIIPRTVHYIFQELEQRKILNREYRIEASFLEIYNDDIVDLLDSEPKTHEIRMVDNKGQDLYVTNLQIEEIHNPEELHECLRTAQRNRAVAATRSNERSSSSHFIAELRFIQEGSSTAKLNLIDLAGSERLETEKARNDEAISINRSLHNLNNVLIALKNGESHVPFRNSKLTYLMMPSLNNSKSKCLMIVNVSPLDECYTKTINALNFATQISNCKTGSFVGRVLKSRSPSPRLTKLSPR